MRRHGNGQSAGRWDLFASLATLFLATLFLATLTFATVGAEGSAAYGQVDGSQGDAIAVVEQAELPAAGRQSTTFRVPTFGRWSVALSSERGVGLQLIDKVTGPGEPVGVAGRQDGRLDLFLDRGEYKIFSLGPQVADGVDLGQAELTVRSFREVEERAVTLPDLARVSTQMGDYEQVSWWLQVDDERPVAFEAAGRHLTDLRLWRDGTWMVGVEPDFEQVEPTVGRPLTLCRLVTVLSPGLYRLTAYGGEGLPWAEDDDSRPLYLRSGVERRGEAGRSLLEVSDYGIDRWVVPASVSFVRLEVPNGDLRQQPVTLSVGDWDSDAPFESLGEVTSTVHKELRELAVEQSHGVEGDGSRVITIRGMAGQPYVLQHFRRDHAYRFSHRGEYWIDTVHSGHPADAVEATGMLVDLTHELRYATPLRAETVKLQRGDVLARRFNLLEPASLFLEVMQRGRYEMKVAGVDAALRLEPYRIPGPRSQDEERPPLRSEGATWDLDRGYYVLSLTPRTQGIADLTLRDAEASDGEPRQWVPGAAPTARLGRVHLDGHSYLFHLNLQPGVSSGVVLRQLPLDLSEPLPFVVGRSVPDLALTVPFRVPGPGTLRAVTEEGDELILSVHGEDRTESAPTERSESAVSVFVAEAGRGVVTVKPPEGLELPVAASLFWESEQIRGPLPELPAGTLEALPELPKLTERQPQFLDLERDRRATYLLQADEAALYRLESTGLLDTAGILRTRVVPEVERAVGEGTGRNFLIQRYLGAGEYQLTVETLGRSAGSLGLRLAAAPVRSAGRLSPGVAARGWIDPGESLEYRFAVEEAGAWRIRVLGLGDSFPVRIEDADGWPIVRPGLPGDQMVRLDAGEHRLVVLPRAVRSRHVALVAPVPETPDRAGHGPFDLALDERVQHVWSEDAATVRDLPESEPLPPDRWRFRLSAEVGLDVELSRDVVADLVRLESGAEQQVARLTALRGLESDVAAGDYELRVRPARRNNRVDYRLRVVPEQFLPGFTREVAVPGTYDLRVGPESLVEIGSLGSLDVRARLVDAEGRQLGHSDDRPGDWNVRLVKRLGEGSYRVELAATADRRGSVTLGVAALEEIEHPPLSAGQDGASGVLSDSLVPGRSVHVWPLEPAVRGGVLMAHAGSAESLRLTVESRGPDGRWRARAWGEDEGEGSGSGAFLAYAATPDESLRLRLEALDRGSSEATVRVRWAGEEAVDESRLARGLRVPDGLGGRGVVAVRLGRPGCFDTRNLPSGATVAGFAGTALRAAPDLATGDGLLMLAAPAASTVRAERWRWRADSEPRRLRLLPGERARCDIETAETDETAMLLSARGLGGQAALALDDGGAQAADGHEALALALPGAQSAVVRWSAEAADADPAWDAQPGEIELSARAVAFGEVSPASDGVAGRLEAGEGALFRLPRGRYRLRLGLSAGVTAAMTSIPISTSASTAPSSAEQGPPPGVVQLLHYSSRRAQEVVRDVDIASDGGALLRLIGPVDQAGRYDVTVLGRSSGKELDQLAPGRPFERRLQRAGVVDLPVASTDAERRVQVRGAERVTVLGADGSVRRTSGAVASAVVPSGGGRLSIEHGPGALVVWLGDGPEDLMTPEVARAAGEPLPLPSVLRLDGAGLATRVELPRPGVLHLRAATPAVSLVTPAGVDPSSDSQVTTVDLHVDDLELDVWLPAGWSDVRLRPLAGEVLHGEMEATVSEVVEVGEGLGPELLLTPGRERWVSFETRRHGHVGVAVRADSEVVRLRWLDARGRPLPGTSDGVLQMADLAPGRYLLALGLAADHGPVRVQPVVVGLEPPTGPPDDVIREYLRSAGAGAEAGETAP